MIGYITIGVTNLEHARNFYLGLFEDKGAKMVIDAGRIQFIGCKKGEPMLAICEPYDKEPQTAGNGVMLAFPAQDKDEIKARYDRAIELGATCDGPPGQRIPDRFHGAYVRDPDGNKLCFYMFG